VTAVASPAVGLGQKALHRSVEDSVASWEGKVAGAAMQRDPAKETRFCNAQHHFQCLTANVVNS